MRVGGRLVDGPQYLLRAGVGVVLEAVGVEEPDGSLGDRRDVGRREGHVVRQPYPLQTADGAEAECAIDDRFS